MASLTKEDRSWLYARAFQLSDAANNMDVHADEAMSMALKDRCIALRAIAAAMHAEARECRAWADSVES